MLTLFGCLPGYIFIFSNFPVAEKPRDEGVFLHAVREVLGDKQQTVIALLSLVIGRVYVHQMTNSRYVSEKRHHT